MGSRSKTKSAELMNGKENISGMSPVKLSTVRSPVLQRKYPINKMDSDSGSESDVDDALLLLKKNGIRISTTKKSPPTNSNVPSGKSNSAKTRRLAEEEEEQDPLASPKRRSSRRESSSVAQSPSKAATTNSPLRMVIKNNFRDRISNGDLSILPVIDETNTQGLSKNLRNRLSALEMIESDLNERAAVKTKVDYSIINKPSSSMKESLAPSTRSSRRNSVDSKSLGDSREKEKISICDVNNTQGLSKNLMKTLSELEMIESELNGDTDTKTKVDYSVIDKASTRQQESSSSSTRSSRKNSINTKAPEDNRETEKIRISISQPNDVKNILTQNLRRRLSVFDFNESDSSNGSDEDTAAKRKTDRSVVDNASSNLNESSSPSTTRNNRKRSLNNKSAIDSPTSVSKRRKLIVDPAISESDSPTKAGVVGALKKETVSKGFADLQTNKSKISTPTRKTRGNSVDKEVTAPKSLAKTRGNSVEKEVTAPKSLAKTRGNSVDKEVTTPKSLAKTRGNSVDKEVATPKSLAKTRGNSVDKEVATPKSLAEKRGNSVDKEVTTPKSLGKTKNNTTSGRKELSNITDGSADTKDEFTISRRASNRVKDTKINIKMINGDATPTEKLLFDHRTRSASKRALSEEPEAENDYFTPKKRRHSEIPKAREPPVTPSSRVISKCATPRTPLEEARYNLHVAAVPESLPCREQEFSQIHSFLENKLLDGIGGCMYISGVPGTGKTATVSSVVRQLLAASARGDAPPFNYVEINGMRLSDPRQAYTLLWQKLNNSTVRISADQAQKKLDAWFNSSNSKKITTVVLVDELDLMCTRKQDVVYNLLDWPSKPKSRLVVLTIANTMDMPERKLKGRVNSRLGLTRLTFLPYTHKQLEEIVLARLQGNESFVPDAIRLATRKVAAVSGDARRALDICRRATELPAADEHVRVKHIEMAIKEMTNSNIVQFIRSCSELEKLFLRAVSEICMRTGLEEVDCLQVFEHVLTLCTLEGLFKPPVSCLLGVCNRLRCFRLMFTNDYRAGVMQRLTLNISQDDLHYALKVNT